MARGARGEVGRAPRGARETARPEGAGATNRSLATSSHADRVETSRKKLLNNFHNDSKNKNFMTLSIILQACFLFTEKANKLQTSEVTTFHNFSF